MATTAGFLSIAAVAGSWVQLPSQACANLIFQTADFDLAGSATPGANYLHIDSSGPNLTIPVVANANTLWIRAQGPISFYWSSP
jgi:hypothetical protein